MNNFKNTLKIVMIAIIALLGVSYVQAYCVSSPDNWCAPTAAPADGNVEAPLNVSTIDQIKTGGIHMGSLVVQGGAAVEGPAGLTIESGVTSTEGGLIIETRTNNPANPEDGRMWLRTDI